MPKGDPPLTLRADSGTPYRLDPDQTLRAATALAKAIERSKQKIEGKKSSLLQGDADGDEEELPIWLVVTAKKHLNDSNKLKPSKLPIPHSLWIAPDTRICLITADPPSSNRTAYKDIVQHRLFPEDLKPRIAKVVSFSKLKTKYKSFESRRHLVAEYDIFLADDRIVTLLPNILGKTFYRATAKRPVPVSLTGKAKYHGKGRENTEGGLKRKRDSVGSGSDTIGLPLDVGADIQKALDSTVLHLAPTVTTAIRVAWAGWPVEWIAENVQAAVEATVTRHIPKGWRGLKSLHIKSADSMALPLWLASELWTNEEDVLNQDAPFADGGFNRKKVKTEGGSIAKIKKEAAELGAVGAKGRKVEPERGSLIKVEKVKSEGEPITKIKKRKSEAEEPVNKTKKRKPGEGGSFDADAQAKIKAKKEKTSKKHHDATAAKLEDSMARKEVVELQERTARKEAAARNAIFELPKKKKEKKEEVVSDVATKKVAIDEQAKTKFDMENWKWKHD